MGHRSLIEHFSIIKDYRQTGKVDHKLTDIILLVVCGVISGAEGWEDITDFGKDRLDWLKQYGDFENGIPSDDTLARVMGRLSPRKVQECFSAWMESCHERTEGQVIAIDGKTLRRSYDKSKLKGAIHTVNAFVLRTVLCWLNAKRRRNQTRLRGSQSYRIYWK